MPELDLYYFMIFYSLIIWFFGYLSGRLHEIRLGKKKLTELVGKEIRKERENKNRRSEKHGRRK